MQYYLKLNTWSLGDKMKIEQIVTSLNISKKLKELGVKQDSFFCWDLKEEIIIIKSLSINRSISAFTASELFSSLPIEIDGLYLMVSRCSRNGYWTTYAYGDINNSKFNSMWSISLCDSLAAMRIYLIENKLIEV